MARRSLLLLTGLALLAASKPASANPARYAIPSGSLARALRLYEIASGAPVLYDKALIRDKLTRGVSGDYEPAGALAKVLEGTGLSARRTGGGVMLIVPTAAVAQARPSPAPDTEPPPTTTVVVTGFRASLQNALDAKRTGVGIIDAVMAEDAARFPDANLAEAIQRIPGVTLTRGDGGEGRQIVVRGLQGAFTRVRIDGIEGLTATGASDILGSTNRTRAFDFSVFASELFGGITVRKTLAADVEEGSLGATVDLYTPKPFDHPGRRFALNAQAQQNSLEGGVWPRVSLLASQATGRWGWSVSAAWSKRALLEEGYEAVDVLPAGGQDGGYCTPVGYAPQTPLDGYRGADALNCADGLPRTSDPSAYAAVFSHSDAWAPNTPGSGAYAPRLPRYRRSLTRYERLGLTGSLQWRPSVATELGLDLLYGRFANVRYDNYIELLSNGRGALLGGKPFSSITGAEVDANGSWVYGQLDGADIRSEALRDKYATLFAQAVVSGSHRVNDHLKLEASAGLNQSNLNEPERTTVDIDAPNVNGFSWDFRQNANVPRLDFGVDVADPSVFRLDASVDGDGTVHGAWLGRRLVTRTRLATLKADATWLFNPWFSLKAGVEQRDNDWRNVEYAPVGAPATLPEGVSLADLTRQIEGFGRGLPNTSLSSWTAIDLDKLLAVYNIECACAAVPGAELPAAPPPREIDERIGAVYAMAAFNWRNGDYGLRGNLGLRATSTHLNASGAATSSAASSPQVSVSEAHHYADLLPSFNLRVELPHDLVLRAAAARVLARPEFLQLAPSVTINTTTQTLIVGNPGLDPIRADTLDFQAEWYFARDSLFSFGLFSKRIDSFVQNYTALLPFNTLGLPDYLLTGGGACSLNPAAGVPCPAQPDTLFSVTRSVNTRGGPIDGLELNYQQGLGFLPGHLRNLGLLFNYTHIASSVEYITALDDPRTPVDEGRTVRGDFPGMSRDALNLTVYYERRGFSGRVSISQKSRAINAALGDVQGADFTFTDPATYVDASFAWRLGPRLRLSLEGANLTDQPVRFGKDTTRNDTLLYVHSGRTVTVGLNWRFH
jgi:TonB-dependent receptor